MMEIGKYVDSKALCSYGFNIDEISLSGVSSNNKRYCLYISSCEDANSNPITLVIGESPSKRGRTEWFFTSIPGMSQEDQREKRHEYFISVVRNMFGRKTRVSRKNLLSKIKEALGKNP